MADVLYNSHPASLGEATNTVAQAHHIPMEY